MDELTTITQIAFCIGVVLVAYIVGYVVGNDAGFTSAKAKLYENCLRDCDDRINKLQDMVYGKTDK